MAGFFAGLLGIGAGIVLVPALYEVFEGLGFPADLTLRLALGTSMAGIVFNSLASLRAHHRRMAVLWPVVRGITPGILAGTLLGTQLAHHLPVRILGIFFAVLLVLIAVQLALEFKPSPHRTLPGRAGMAAVGGGIGLLMSLIAGGGGALSVPFLLWCNIGVREAIGTAAAIGFPIAISGTLGFVIAGWDAPGLPAWSLGYVYLPALAVIAAASSATAPLGAQAAHRMPTRTLRRIFAAVMFLVAARMFYRLTL
ncbi:MAG: hypothetical protein C0522_03210 [Rhodocyclaceae bacterium]|nr:hypothetical protein [Rhodocyclaceae bacterium]